jgi:hypothetical protein
VEQYKYFPSVPALACYGEKFTLNFKLYLRNRVALHPFTKLYAFVLSIIFIHGATASSGPGPLQYRGFTVTLRHATLGRTPLDE